MSLPEELELIHFDNEPHISKKEQHKESKKQGKRAKGSNSKKTSAVTYVPSDVPSDPSLGIVQVGIALRYYSNYTSNSKKILSLIKKCVSHKM